MKALTLWPEWAWAICHLGKNVENRSWVIPPGLYCLHAGMRFGGKGRSYANWLSAINTVVRVGREQSMTMTQRHRLDLMEHDVIRTGHVVGLIRVTGHTNYLRQEQWNRSMGWAAPGQIANHIELIHTLPTPIPCKGALGLWTVPDNITHQLETVCLPD